MKQSVITGSVRVYAALLLICVGVFSAQAETPRGAQGLLELPALRAHVLAGKPLDSFALQVYDAPMRAAKARKVLSGTGPAQLVLKEHGYEEYSVVVLERKPGWARVALGGGQSGQQGSAWLPEPSGATFRAYADLVKESLAFLTEAWDGRVWDAPGGVARSVAFKQIQRPEHPADVFGYRELNGQLWLHVNVFSESPCEQQQPLSLSEGWIPAYSPQGAWTADFYARGC